MQKSESEIPMAFILGRRLAPVQQVRRLSVYPLYVDIEEPETPGKARISAVKLNRDDTSGNLQLIGIPETHSRRQK